MDNFPTKGSPLERGESPSLYDLAWPVENVEKAQTDGGYEYRRRKFTRTPRRQITTGFIDLCQRDYLYLEQFWLKHQKDSEFIYYDYMTNVSRVVRFDDFKPTSKTIGRNLAWDLKIKMSEI